MSAVKVLLVSADNALDPNAWSGTAYQARSALEAAGHEVVVLTGLPTTRRPWHLALRMLLGDARYPLWMTRSTLRQLGRRLETAEEQHHPDVILSISSQYLVSAVVRAPVVMFSDAPWQTFRERYKPYQHFAAAADRYERLEADAARRASHLVYSSQWAKDEAVRLFQVPPDRVSVAPLGANWIPGEAGPAEPSNVGPKQLLFIGRDWARKGGDLAVAVQQQLRRDGVDAQLTIVGVEPAVIGTAASAEGVTVAGLTGILDWEATTSIATLFQRSHLLIVPSRAECFGIVYAEAAAFGRPAIALRVDAVGEVVEDGETGLLFPPGADAVAIAARVAELLGDQEEYHRLSLGARAKYEESLNWHAFGERITYVLETLSA